jgi:hypothetical protein
LARTPGGQGRSRLALSIKGVCSERGPPTVRYFTAQAITDVGQRQIPGSEDRRPRKSTIRVTGKVIVKVSQPQIEVDDPGQIEVV